MTSQQYLEQARLHYAQSVNLTVHVEVRHAIATAGLLAIELYKVARAEEQLKELDLLADRLKAVTERGKR